MNTTARYVHIVDLADELCFQRLALLTIFFLKIEITPRPTPRRATVLHADLKGIVMTTGTVKFFNSTKGFGFIEQGNGQPDVFVHISAVERAGMRSLTEGQKIAFEIVADRRSGKSAAENLQAA